MPDFHTLNDALENAGASCGVAEAHGMLCGILCAEAQQSGTRWLAEIFPDNGQQARPGHCREPLGELFAQTFRGLEEGQMEFMPLLPGDGEALDQRTDSLGKWCQGFLSGLGLGGLGDTQDRLPENVSEVMVDLAQIAQAIDGGGDEEEEEAAFTALLEYLRVSVQLIYEELAGLRGPVGERPVTH